MNSSSSHWEGDATLFDGVSARPQTVRLRIDAAGIVLTVGAQTFPVAREKVFVRERHRRESARLEIPLYPEGAILVRDAGAIGTLDVLGYRLGSGRRSTGPTVKRLAAFFVALVLLLVLFFTWGVDRIADIGVRLVPEDVERELGQAVYRALVDEARVVRNPDMNRALASCGEVVREFGARGAEQVVISVVDDTSIVNAFALPGGRIVLYRGILQLLETEDELLGLLAHELGHVHHRHGMRHVARKAVLGFVFATLFGEASGIAAVLIDNGAVLVELAYGRKEEEAADVFALQAMQRAGLDAHGLVSLFEKLDGIETIEIPEILSTHPTTSSRIESLRGRLDDAPARARPPVFSPDEWRVLTGHAAASSERSP